MASKGGAKKAAQKVDPDVTKQPASGVVASRKTGRSSGAAASVASTSCSSASAAAQKEPCESIDDIFASLPTKKKQAVEEKRNSQAAREKEKHQAIRSSKQLKEERGSYVAGEGWKDDGLGGVYNEEGWTGRTTGDTDKCRIFKTHLLSSAGNICAVVVEAMLPPRDPTIMHSQTSTDMS
jgi:hypothetical protein